MEENIEGISEGIVVPPMLDAAWKYFLFGFVAISAPIFNFSFIELLKPEWQDGKFSSYINLFLLPEASLWFFPLLVYAVGCYLLLLLAAERYAKFFGVRFGVYTGAFLALQYSLLTLTGLDSPSGYFYVLLIYFAPFVFARFHRRLTSKWRASLVNGILIGLGLAAFVAAMTFMGSPSSPFVLLLMFLGISAPFWCFLIALQAARWLWKHHETTLTLPRGFGIFAWLSAYAFALQFDILKMFELYNALPTEPPNCYIATAAAKGHPRFVGSREVTLANGKTMRVNRQLQRLKAAEIAWVGISAPSHRMMRRLYDVIGKRLAKRIQNPILADIAYFILIPVELFSFFVLKSIIPEIQILSERLYRS
ncbi:MAG: hypothetical protein IPG44_01385 [Anaerolineales bacterium]|nr:hypothetical protein [Chloroflexota bacterium]MBK6644398.1 hypothetical protein [Anaerolineales bacterium]